MNKLSVKLLISAAGSIAGAVLEIVYIWAVCSFGESMYRFAVFAFIPRVISSLILSRTVWKSSRLGVGAILYIVSGIMAYAILMILFCLSMKNFD